MATISPSSLTKLWAVATICPLFSACLTRTYTPHEPGAGQPLTNSAVQTVDSWPEVRHPAPTAIRLAPYRVTSDYEISDFKKPSSGFNRQPGNLVRGRYFRAHGAGRRPLVIVLPIWGRSFYPPSVVSLRLTRHGEVDVLLIEGEVSLIDWEAVAAAPSEQSLLDEFDRAAAAFRATVVDVHRLVDWGLEQPHIDADRIGIVGFSVSAFLGSIAMGLDDRITRGAFVMGGAHLDEVLAFCNSRSGRAREPVLERFGWTADQYRAKIAPALEVIDPMQYVGGIDPENVLLIQAENDRCVPESARNDLWEAMHRPQRVTLSGGHRSSFLALTILDSYRETRRIARFFHSAPFARETAPRVASPR